MTPCEDCLPHECHGNPHARSGFGGPHSGHVRAQAYTHDGQIIDYCIYCLARLKFIHNRWQTDIVVKEWP